METPHSCCQDQDQDSAGATFSKLLRKILGRFLIVGQSLTIYGKTLTRHNFALLTNLRLNNHVGAKIKVLITIIIALSFPISRLLLCQTIFLYGFPKMRNLPKIFLRRFENVAPDVQA